MNLLSSHTGMCGVVLVMKVVVCGRGGVGYVLCKEHKSNKGNEDDRNQLSDGKHDL